MNIKKDLFTIKEFSQLTNISTDTLRYYDKIGIFKPSYRDNNTRYRYYTLNEFEEIGVIQTLQLFGLTLKEIKEYENSKTFFSSYKLLNKQFIRISEKIEELQLIKHYLNEKILILNDIINNSLKDKIIIKDYPERVGYSSDRNCRNYQEIKAESARIIEKYSKNLFISNAYAINIPLIDLISGDYKNNFYCVILDIDKDKNTPFKKIVYPKGKYVTYQYSGTSFDRNDAISKIISYIQEKQYTIIGDAVQLCIIDENLTKLDSEKINEIQVPILMDE